MIDTAPLRQWPGISALSGERGFAILLPLGLLGLAVACGGASAGQPLRDIIVESFAVVVLGAAALGWIGQGWSPDARFLLILIAALALLFILQIVPLPEGVWSALQGREVDRDVLKLIDEPVGMRPLSIQPELTVLAALGVLPGVAMGMATLRLGVKARVLLAWGLVVAALASLVLGAAQMSLGDGAAALTLYTNAHIGLPIGFFANTNHQADLLLIGLVMAGMLAPPASGANRGWADRRWWAYGVMAALAVGVVAGGSRAGIALMGLGLVAVLLRERLTGQTRLFLAGGLSLVVVIMVAVSPIFMRSFADFSNIDDPRFHFWPNVMWAIGHFGWLGTGAGTFDGVYRSVETLDTLSSRFLNHAHNDYLEIMLEMGAPGILLLICFVGFLGWRGYAIVRRTDMRGEISLAYGGMVCVGLLLLHSAFDYPLRTPLLGVAFGLCCGLMTRLPQGEADQHILKPRQSGVSHP